MRSRILFPVEHSAAPSLHSLLRLPRGQPVGTRAIRRRAGPRWREGGREYPAFWALPGFEGDYSLIGSESESNARPWRPSSGHEQARARRPGTRHAPRAGLERDNRA